MIGEFSEIRILDENGQPLTLEMLAELDFGAISFKEIAQNVKTILLTPLFTVPLDRLLGMDLTLVDYPINYAQTFLIPEILDRIHRFERRVEVLEINFEGDALVGHLIPILRLRVRNETYRDRIPYTEQNAFGQRQLAAPQQFNRLTYGTRA